MTRKLLLALALTLALTSCAKQSGSTIAPTTTDPLKNMALAIKDAAVVVGQLQTTVINANAAKLTSDDDTANILLICRKFNAADQQASAITRAYTKMTAADKGNLVLIVNPLLQAVSDSISSGLLTIKDPGTRQNVLTALQLIKTGLLTVQAVISATKQPTAWLVPAEVDNLTDRYLLSYGVWA